MSETSFKELIKQNEKISPEVRQRLDETYREISVLPQKRPMKKRPFNSWKLAVILLLGVAVGFSPLGVAAKNFLQFGAFTSQKLTKGNFIVEPKISTKKSETTIQLAALYADQNALGLNFQIKLPKNSPLLAQELTEYSLNFAIKDQSGHYVFDLNSGLLKEAPTLAFDLARMNAELDRTSRELTINYRLYAKESGHLSNLQNMEIAVTKINAFETTNEQKKPGFHQLKGETIADSWRLPMNELAIQQFPAVHYFPESKGDLVIEEAIAYPTSVVVRIEKKKFDQLAMGLNYEEITLKKGNTPQATLYFYQKADIIMKDNQEYLEFTYDYSGYDDKEILIFNLGDRSEHILRRDS